ncbi:MAG: sensor histidine kinase [Saprospiraceae bacterium]
MAETNTKRRLIEFTLWLLLFLSSFAFYTRMTHWSKAFGIAMTFLVLYMSLVYLNRKILIPILFNQSRYLAYVISIFGLLFLVGNLVVELDYLSVFDIKLELYTTDSDAIQQRFSKGSNRVKLSILLGTAITVILISLVYQVTLDYIKKQQEKIQLEREKTQAEMSYLKAQMHPHFFLNALNGLYALARLSPQKTGAYITKLSQMLTYLTYEANSPEVLLEREVNYLENYVYFQQYKADAIRVEWEVNIEDSQYRIEPFLLIPFVENAFKHGENKKSNPIYIHLQQKERELIFECKNTSSDTMNTTKDPSYSGIGIENVSKRLQLKYPNQFKLDYGQQNGIFKVFLSIQQNG